MDNSVVAPWLVVILVLGAIAFSTGFRQGSLISPFSISLLMLGSIYGIRPLLMVDANEYGFYGTDIQTGFIDASIIGLVAVAALIGGYTFSQVVQDQLGKTSLAVEIEPHQVRPRQISEVSSSPLLCR